MRSIGPYLISKIISAINLKLNGLDQLQHHAITAGNLISKVAGKKVTIKRKTNLKRKNLFIDVDVGGTLPRKEERQHHCRSFF